MANRATQRIGIVVRTVPAVVDCILARGCGAPFEESQFAQQPGMVRDRNRAAHEVRHRLQIQDGSRLLATAVIHASLLEGSSDPLASVGIPDNGGAVIILGELGVFGSDRGRVERRLAAAQDITDETVTVAMADRASEMVTTSSGGIHE